MSMPFDRLAYIDRLKDAGVEEPIARAHAQALREALEEGVATKADLEAVEGRLGTRITDLRTELKGDIAELRTELKGDIAELRAELKGDMAELRAEVKGDITGLRTEMGEMRTSLKSDIQRLDAKIDITARDLVIKGAGGLVILASLMIGLKLFG